MRKTNEEIDANVMLYNLKLNAIKKQKKLTTEIAKFNKELINFTLSPREWLILEDIKTFDVFVNKIIGGLNNDQTKIMGCTNCEEDINFLKNY